MASVFLLVSLESDQALNCDNKSTQVMGGHAFSPNPDVHQRVPLPFFAVPSLHCISILVFWFCFFRRGLVSYLAGSSLPPLVGKGQEEIKISFLVTMPTFQLLKNMLLLVACLLGCLLGCLVGWLVGWSVGWLVAWLLGWLLACLVACLLCCLLACLVGWLAVCLFVCLFVCVFVCFFPFRLLVLKGLYHYWKSLSLLEVCAHFSYFFPCWF